MPDDITPIPNTAYPIIDHIVKQEGQGTYNVYFKELNEVDGTSIKQWLKQDFSYNDLIAPGIPTEGINGNSFNNFNKVAFTGSYEDLSDAPTIPVDLTAEQKQSFNSVAFTGVTAEVLNDVQVTDILDLTQYSTTTYTGSTAEMVDYYTNELHKLGGKSIFIRGLSSELINALDLFIGNFESHKGKKSSYIVSNAGTFLVLNADFEKPGNFIRFYRIDVANINTSHYTWELDNATTDQAAEDVLESITADSKLISFIFDAGNSIPTIYCKINDIDNGVTSYNDLTDKPTLFSGDYEDLENKPVYNLDASDINTDITGLATIATTGSYDDLEDSFYNITLSDFIYKYENNSFTQLTGNDYNNIVSLGLHNRYIEDIDKIYNGTNEDAISLKTAILNLVNVFSNNKQCGFITQFNNQLFIDNISTNYSGNNLNHVSIITRSILVDNYDSNIIDTTNFEDGLQYSLYTAFFVFDFINNIVYAKYLSTFPLDIADQSMTFDALNTIKVNISNRANNKLELITNGSEAGLYVE